jgi:hypothetical protein
MSRTKSESVLSKPIEKLEMQMRRKVSGKTKRLQKRLSWKAWLRRQIKWRWLKSIVPR